MTKKYEHIRWEPTEKPFKKGLYETGPEDFYAPYYDRYMRASGQIVEMGDYMYRQWASGKRTRVLPFILDVGQQYKRTSNPNKRQQRNYANCVLFGRQAALMFKWYRSFTDRSGHQPYVQVWGKWESIWELKDETDPMSPVVNTGRIKLKAEGWCTVPLLQSHKAGSGGDHDPTGFAGILLD